MSAKPTLTDTAFVDDLQSRLTALSAKRRNATLTIGLHVDGRAILIDAGRSQGTVGGGSHAGVRLGCITKLLTASLGVKLLPRLGLPLDSDAERLLGLRPRASAAANISLRHLLEHRHGLDDAGIGPGRFVRGRFIDRDGLRSFVADADRLAGPGRFYSYSSLGALLLGSLLEDSTGMPFGRLLQTEIFGPLDIELAPARGAAASRQTPPCPSTGGSLRLSIDGMLRFLIRHGPDRPAGAGAADNRSPAIFPLPGWHPIERGIRLGWKYYGGDWYGHDSVWPGAAALARVNRRRAIAVVVVANAYPPNLIAAKLLGEILPRFRAVDMPAAASAARLAALDAARYAGDYRGAGLRIRVTADAADGLRLCCDAAPRSGRTSSAGSADCMIPADDHLFLLRGVQPPPFSYVQFVDAAASGFRYMWNGQRLFRRVSTSA